MALKKTKQYQQKKDVSFSEAWSGSCPDAHFVHGAKSPHTKECAQLPEAGKDKARDDILEPPEKTS